MTKESREKRGLRREIRNAKADLADIMEELNEFAEEYTGELKPLRQEITGLVSAMERYNRASGQRQTTLMARAQRMGITIKPNSSISIKDISALVEDLKKQGITREVPIELRTRNNVEFFGDRFYVTSVNTEQIQLYECTSTPVDFNIVAGALYA